MECDEQIDMDLEETVEVKDIHIQGGASMSPKFQNLARYKRFLWPVCALFTLSTVYKLLISCNFVKDKCFGGQKRVDRAKHIGKLVFELIMCPYPLVDAASVQREMEMLSHTTPPQTPPQETSLASQRTSDRETYRAAPEAAVMSMGSKNRSHSLRDVHINGAVGLYSLGLLMPSLVALVSISARFS